MTDNNSLQRDHHQRITDERYACIFHDLAKFDEETSPPSTQYPHPLLRAALNRAESTTDNHANNDPRKLLSITADLTPNVLSPSNVSMFYGLQHADTYREMMLSGLWQYQPVDQYLESLFNRWLTSRSPHCAVCYLLTTNQSERQSVLPLHSVLFFKESRRKASPSNDLLTCSQCQIRVHRECYESTCLILNVKNDDQSNPWYCQRCCLRRPVRQFSHSYWDIQHRCWRSLCFSALQKCSTIIVLLVCFVVVSSFNLTPLHSSLMQYVHLLDYTNHHHHPYLCRSRSSPAIIVGPSVLWSIEWSLRIIFSLAINSNARLDFILHVVYWTVVLFN